MPSTSTSDLKISSRPPATGFSEPVRPAPERRRHVRYPFAGTFEAFEPGSQIRIQGRAADLSEGGCYIDTMSPLPAQSLMRVRLTRGKRSFESEATVVYSVVGMGMGLRFESPGLPQLMILRKWLGELSGESITETEIEEKVASVPAPGGSNRVLSELVSELMRKGILTEDMGRGMLQRLASPA